ncbi:MAG: tetratricopeptide repeat protein, partial [Candidatus Sericytochromatia bacterium]|nr:tetratricopeptide repeat protein [Candidatus Sericytochromatia bacterium]
AALRAAGHLTAAADLGGAAAEAPWPPHPALAPRGDAARQNRADDERAWQTQAESGFTGLAPQVRIKCGKLHAKIGKTYFFFQNAMSVALEHFVAAREHFAAAGDTSLLVGSDSQVGWALRTQGKRDEALAYCHKAMDAAEAQGLLPEVGEAGHNLGNLYREIGDLAKAEQYFVASIAAYEQAKARQNFIAKSKSGLAMVYADLSRWQEATELQAWCMDLVERIGIISGQMTIGFHLGNCYLNTGDLTKAETYFNRSLALSRDKGDVRRQGKCWESLAKVAQIQGRHESAVSALQHALVLARDAGAPVPEQAKLLCDILESPSHNDGRSDILDRLAQSVSDLPPGPLLVRAQALMAAQPAGSH